MTFGGEGRVFLRRTAEEAKCVRSAGGARLGSGPHAPLGGATDSAALVSARFQGQEAPVVIYSMGTSASEDAPRTVDFLFSLNRLNIATSRTQAVAILIASPRLLETECKAPEQMKLVNRVCGVVEAGAKCRGMNRSGTKMKDSP